MAGWGVWLRAGGTNKAKLCKCIDEAQHDTALWARITGVVGADEVRNDVEQCAAVHAPIAVNDAVKEAEEAGAVAAEVKEEDAERTTEKVRWPILQRNVLLSS
jgi:hypothetical protein